MVVRSYVNDGALVRGSWRAVAASYWRGGVSLGVESKWSETVSWPARGSPVGAAASGRSAGSSLAGPAAGAAATDFRLALTSLRSVLFSFLISRER